MAIHETAEIIVIANGLRARRTTELDAHAPSPAPVPTGVAANV